MLSIALRSRWGIPAFVASMAIELLQFLSLTAILSASACLVWGFTFLIDIILMDFLRQDRKPKTHKLRFSDAEEECVHDEAFVHHIRAEIDMYLSHDNSSAEWTAVALDMMLPAREHLRSPDRPVESSVCFVWRLWEIFVYFACQIPHNHLYQDKLVALVVALSKRPTVLVRDRDVSRVTSRFLDEVAILLTNAWCLRDCSASGMQYPFTIASFVCAEEVSVISYNPKPC